MTPAMWAELALQLGPTILGVGFLGAVLQYAVARKKLPVERDTAAAVASEQIVRAAAALVEPLRQQIEDLEHRVEAAEKATAEARQLAERNATENRTLRRIAADADEYVTDLHERWPHHRQQPAPPRWRWADD